MCVRFLFSANYNNSRGIWKLQRVWKKVWIFNKTSLTFKKILQKPFLYQKNAHWTKKKKTVDDSIGDSDGESATSLYGYLGLNPSVKSSEKIHESATLLDGYLGLNPPVIPSVKSSYKNPRHHTVATFQTNCIGHRRYGRYIPTEYFRWYRPTLSPTE